MSQSRRLKAFAPVFTSCLRQLFEEIEVYRYRYTTALGGVLKAFLSRRDRSGFRAIFFLIFCLMFCGAVLSLHAQRDRRDYAQQRDDVNAGGNWREYDSEDAMTAARRVRFEIVSDTYSRDRNSSPSRIEIFCENGKYKGSDFTPGGSLGPPTHPGFWGQPKMEVMVRVDNKHGNHGWNWHGRALSMDKNTTRELIGAQLFRIEFLGRGGPEISEFSPAGLDLSRVSHACDLTPKRP